MTTATTIAPQSVDRGGRHFAASLGFAVAGLALLVTSSTHLGLSLGITGLFVAAVLGMVGTSIRRAADFYGGVWLAIDAPRSPHDGPREMTLTIQRGIAAATHVVVRLECEEAAGRRRVTSARSVLEPSPLGVASSRIALDVPAEARERTARRRWWLSVEAEPREGPRLSRAFLLEPGW
ncbi:MAG: hypothetical protein U0234_15530 [Sandaracinus sp.]